MNPFYTMPNILTETSEGATAHSLQDELFKEREIELVGEITQESAYSIILQLRYLQKSDSAAPMSVSPRKASIERIALKNVSLVISSARPSSFDSFLRKRNTSLKYLL